MLDIVWTSMCALLNKQPSLPHQLCFIHMSSQRETEISSNQTFDSPLPEGGVSLWPASTVNNSDESASPKHMGCMIGAWYSPERRDAANAGHVPASLTSTPFDANCPAVGTSPDQDLDWSTADSLERDIITMSHLAHIEGSLW